MCINRPNLYRAKPARTHFAPYHYLLDARGANHGSSWENAYVYFIEFLQYPDIFAYDTIKADSLRRYFDGLTVLHITYR